MILSEQGKSGDAINIFQKLTEDYPELPEPYNNLAVLHASAGNYDKARVALERAIRTNPAYATAHENLGDVYAKLASQSYDKAMQLADPGQPPAKSKLAMVRTLTSKGGEAAAPQAVAALAAPPAPAKAQVLPAPAAPPAPALAPAAASKPAPAVQLAKAEAEKAGKEDADGADVNKAVENWAKAWSSQNMKGYLNAYSSSFKPPKGQDRKAWEADRTARIEGKGHIKVTIESPLITVSGNSATVKFRQKYVSDRLSSTSRKTLVLEKQGRNWLIKQEQSGA